MRGTATVNDRVAFLYAHAEGAANLGRVVELDVDAPTWSRAKVAWDNGDCGWCRHVDLVPLGVPLRFWAA